MARLERGCPLAVSIIWRNAAALLKESPRSWGSLQLFWVRSVKRKTLFNSFFEPLSSERAFSREGLIGVE